MISIALIDDHPLAINGIGAWLKSTGKFEIVGTAGTLADADKLMKRLDPLPVIIILDISLGEEDGLEFIPALKKICAARKAALPGILVCSMFEDPFLIQWAIDLGARAYVSKSAGADEMIAAIDTLLGGGTYINQKYKPQTKKQNEQVKHLLNILTSREKEIVSLIKQSLQTKEIAKRLGISHRTVENHIVHIYTKTGLSLRKDLYEL